MARSSSYLKLITKSKVCNIMLKSLGKITLLSVLMTGSAVTISHAFGCSFDGPPWDPCQLFESDDVPSSDATATVYVTQAPTKANQIYNTPVNIDQIDALGLLGDYSQKQQNGMALEFLMWQAGFQKPKKHYGALNLYKANEFYNGIYGNSFRFFLKPFDYQNGWKVCQALKYAPSKKEMAQATDVINQFKTLINALTKPYHNKTAKEETANELYDRQTQFNHDAMNAVKKFDYDKLMNYARSELANYINIQNSNAYNFDYYINPNCKVDTKGYLSQHPFNA